MLVMNNKIRVGIVSLGGWAKYGHIPVLQVLPDYEIVAVSSRKKETTDEYVTQFNIQHSFDD
jgi:predicted dehydrogenase